MNTLQRVLNAIYQFEGLTGRKIRAIYFGTNTFDRMHPFITSLSLAVDDKVVMRPHFNGVPIFLVDADEHVGVG